MLDLSRLFAGNVLTQMLADFGADVIKIEPQQGDSLREWKTDGIETHWKVYARNKRSLALSLRDARAIDLLKRLVATADILVESFRPGVLEAMGLAPDVLHAANPRLCICRISGWGQTGPYAQRPAFGTIVEGFTGFAAMNGFADREPLLPSMYLADGVAGLHGAAAVMIALREVEVNGGKGQVIDLSLLDPLLALLGPQPANYRINGKVKPRIGIRSSNSAPRNVYRCSDDRYLSLSASTQQMAERLLRTMDRAELIDGPRFRTNSDRVANVDVLDGLVAAFIAQRSQAENLALFENSGITVGPINEVPDILANPHIIARDVIVELPDKGGKPLPMSNVTPPMSRTPGTFRRPAPAIGENNREILSEIGVTAGEYDALLASRTVFEPA